MHVAGQLKNPPNLGKLTGLKANRDSALCNAPKL
jgi:hypothetical protein